MNDKEHFKPDDNKATKHKCSFCDEIKVEWNGWQWECRNCGAKFGHVEKPQ